RPGECIEIHRPKDTLAVRGMFVEQRVAADERGRVLVSMGLPQKPQRHYHVVEVLTNGFDSGGPLVIRARYDGARRVPELVGRFIINNNWVADGSPSLVRGTQHVRAFSFRVMTQLVRVSQQGEPIVCNEYRASGQGPGRRVEPS